MENPENKNIPRGYQLIDGVLVPKEKKVNVDSPARSIAKSISWRFVASTTTFSVFAISAWIRGEKINAEILLAIVGVEAIIKMIVYFFHERVWANVRWGRNWRKYKFIRRIKLEYIKFKRRER